VLATDIGREAVVGDHAAADAARQFFIECYHFKDWLKKDARITRPEAVEDHISGSPALAIAGDLCNSFKHAGLDKKPRSGLDLSQINMAYSLDLPVAAEPGTIRFERNPSDGDTITISRSNRIGPPIATARVTLTLGGNRHDAFDVAQQCIADWNVFLLASGIPLDNS
jgi:hypothetical protein